MVEYENHTDTGIVTTWYYRVGRPDYKLLMWDYRKCKSEHIGFVYNGGFAPDNCFLLGGRFMDGVVYFRDIQAN